MRTMLLMSLVLAATACGGGSSPTSPSANASPGISGAWSGTLSASGQRDEEGAQIRVNLTQTGSNVTGTWTLLEGDGSVDSEGTVSASVNGTNINGTMTVLSNCPPGSSAVINGTINNAVMIWTSATGFSSSFFECRSGGFRVTLQRR